MLSIPPEVNRAINMTEIRESLKSNPTYLLVCIQYEVLEGLPCSASFKRFCSKFGDDIMDFPEFEYLFMRFYNGETDLKNDWDEVKVQKKQLCNLPTDIFKLILDELDEESKIAARQVSTGIRDLIRTPFISTLIEVNRDGFKVNGEEFSFHGPHRRCWIDERRKVEFDVKEFKSVLRSKLKSEFIDLDLTMVGSVESSELFLEGIQNLPYPVKNLKVHFEINQPIIDFLKSLSGPLEKIELTSSEEKSHLLGDDFLEIEQIKSAKSLFLTWFGLFLPSDLCRFYPCEEFECRLNFVSMDALVKLRENCRTSPSFKKCVIHTSELYDPDEIEAALGMKINGNKCEIREKIPGSDDILLWYFSLYFRNFSIEKMRF